MVPLTIDISVCVVQYAPQSLSHHGEARRERVGHPKRGRYTTDVGRYTTTVGRYTTTVVRYTTTVGRYTTTVGRYTNTVANPFRNFAYRKLRIRLLVFPIKAKVD